MCDFINKIILIADEENYDRDSLIEATVDMMGAMAEISTFKNFNADFNEMYPKNKISLP